MCFSIIGDIEEAPMISRKAVAMAKAKTTPNNTKRKASKSLHRNTSMKLDRTAVTDEERKQLIMRAAYFRSEKRGFAPGAELDDWLQAETEIDGEPGNILAGD